MNGESTTLCAAREQDKLFFFCSYSGLQCGLFSSCCTFWSLRCSQVVAKGACSWQFWVWDKIQTAGQVSQKTPNLCYSCKCKKWIPEKAVWKAKLQPLVSSGKQHNYWLQQCGIASVISNWKCQYLNLILYKTGSNKIPKSPSLGTNKPILHCTRRASLLYTTTTKLVTTQSLLFLNAKFTSGRLRLSFPFFPYCLLL